MTTVNLRLWVEVGTQPPNTTILGSNTNQKGTLGTGSWHVGGCLLVKIDKPLSQGRKIQRDAHRGTSGEKLPM